MSCHASGADEEGSKLSCKKIFVRFELPAYFLRGGLDEAEGERFQACGDGVVGGEDGAHG